MNRESEQGNAGIFLYVMESLSTSLRLEENMYCNFLPAGGEKKKPLSLSQLTRAVNFIIIIIACILQQHLDDQSGS